MSARLFMCGTPVYKVVVGGMKCYTMCEWWEIVVYYNNSMLIWFSHPPQPLSTLVAVGAKTGSSYQVC